MVFFLQRKCLFGELAYGGWSILMHQLFVAWTVIHGFILPPNKKKGQF